MKTFTFGNKSGPDIIFQATREKIWLARLWQVNCLSEEKRMVWTKRCEGPAIISCSLGRYEADSFKLVKSGFTRRQASIAWSAADGKLRLESRWNYDAGTKVLSRRDRLINTGKKPVTIFRCLPRFVLPPNNYEVYFQQSRWCHENQGEWIKLRAGAIVLESEWGRSTEGATPYLGLREQDGSSGLAFHVIPNGNWIIRVNARIAANLLPIPVIEMGLSDNDLRLTIESKNALELPEIIIQPLPDGKPEKAAPQLHCYLNKRAPLPYHKEIPVIYNTWFDHFDQLNLDRMRAQLKAAAEIGCEAFVIDAGWFGGGEGWGAVGDWREKTDCAFYGKMKDFANEVRRNGLGFGLWMEPERYADNIPIRKKHPEWFVDGSWRIRMENKKARAYVAGEISRLIETYRLAWLKIDHNASLGYDDTGAELYNYYSAWYELLDNLRRKYPRTVFENCSSGAMRHDLSSLFHFDVHFPSDTANPMDVLRISQGGMLRMPPGRITRWATPIAIGNLPLLGYPPETRQVLTPGGATWNTAETADPDFVVIAAMYGILVFSGDLQSLGPQLKSRTRWYVDFYKKWRRLILNSAGYFLTPIQPLSERKGWTVIQLQAAKSTASIIFHFYKPNDGRERRLVQLQNLDPAVTYRVRRISPDNRAETESTGAKLMQTGLELYEQHFMHNTFRAGITTVEPKKVKRQN